MEEMKPISLELSENTKQLHYWAEELDKCMKSPYYFYKNYVHVNGEKATTLLTEEEFNSYFKKK